MVRSTDRHKRWWTDSLCPFYHRAETVSYEDLVSYKTITLAKEQGLVRSEGKDYIVQEGDVILFRFNV